MGLLWLTLMSAALAAFCGSCLAAVLRVLVRPSSGVGPEDVLSYYWSWTWVNPRTSSSGDIIASPAPAPDWLRIPEWVVRRVERDIQESGPLGFRAGQLAGHLAVATGASLLFSAAAMPLALALLVPFLGPAWGIPLGVGGPLLFAAGGSGNAFAAHRSLVARARARLHNVRHQLPHACDFLVLVLDAGGSVEGALQAYLDHGPTDELHAEVHLLLQELRAGTTLVEAFDRFGRRNPTREVDRMVLVVFQAAKMGTPILNALRDQAELLRLERLQRAGETAEKTALAAEIPLLGVVCALVIVLVAPFFMRAIPGALDLFGQ